MKINLATLLYFTLILLAIILILPKSLLGFYHVQTFSAIYLPNLMDTKFKSIIAYVTFVQILSLIFKGSALSISNIAGITSVLSVIFSYILLFRVIDGDTKIKSIISFLYPVLMICASCSNILAGYVSGLSMILYFMICFFFLDERRKYNYISLFFVALISWITLGLFWHSVYVMAYFIFVFYIVTSNLYHIRNAETFPLWNILILLTVSFLFMWIYLREDVMGNSLNLENLRLIGLSSIFNKGSFTGIYTYNHNLQTYLGYVDIMRYLGYLLAYIIILIFVIDSSISFIRKKKVSKNQIFLITLFISEILFIFLYFISTGTFGVRVLLTFSYPLIIIMLNDNQHLCIKCLNNFNLRIIITLFLIIPFILTSAFSLYNYLTESPEQNISIDTYENSFGWISEYSCADMIFSDAHTSGHYQLSYSLKNFFDRNQLDFCSVDYIKYEKIVNTTYNPSDNSLLVINEILYNKHLQFQSLEAWNTFEPLSPEYIEPNIYLNKVYNDGSVIIAQ
ncbi:hypothetical protein [Methanosarcina mazei]|uniref:Uncharacterized protein n=2 Tax=Methanosarcina mazei TaxID=2209 RepID=A0A0F8JR21_METMZ|nr:hypothetical protein [Methanosarcina mazei]AKB70027.1 hypothetical protein MSMAC_0137 [Methanosarcina mazei C16]KKG71275.1 hypothetical protein DU46_08850 [Methanosarcina mazei]KKG84695.1 hypothetical protein DU61_12615 [Methanosarcina mazei]KKH09213.1 hypothetical protein DU51_00935 [Methanosarcina mazei]KKH09882.1 hypothetical protein DU62_08055 [Methanosarcina mazei]